MFAQAGSREWLGLEPGVSTPPPGLLARLRMF